MEIIEDADGGRDIDGLSIKEEKVEEEDEDPKVNDVHKTWAEKNAMLIIGVSLALIAAFAILCYRCSKNQRDTFMYRTSTGNGNYQITEPI